MSVVFGNVTPKHARADQGELKLLLFTARRMSQKKRRGSRAEE